MSGLIILLERYQQNYNSKILMHVPGHRLISTSIMGVMYCNYESVMQSCLKHKHTTSMHKVLRTCMSRLTLNQNLKYYKVLNKYCICIRQSSTSLGIPSPSPPPPPTVDGNNQAAQQEEDSDSLQLHGGKN